MVTTLTESYKAERQRITSNGHRPPKAPFLQVVGRWLGRHLPVWAVVRTAAMQWAGAALGVAAAAVTFGAGAALLCGAVWLFVAAQLHAGPDR